MQPNCTLHYDVCGASEYVFSQPITHTTKYYITVKKN